MTLMKLKINFFKMDIQAMVGRNGELQTAACNRLKLVARKGSRTLGQTSPEGSSVVQQSNAAAEHANM